MKLAVTGASGFVGSALVDELVRDGHQVKRLIRRSSAVRESDQAESVVGSLSDDHALERLCSGADAVFHLVAVIRERGDSNFQNINIMGTQRVLEAAKEASVGRFIHLSALGADSMSPHAYLRSKGLGEEVVKASGLNYTVLRSSIIYGPDDEFVNLLAAVILALPVVPIIGPGTNLFQPISVRNTCQIMRGCLESDEHHGRSYDLGGPDQLRYDEIVRAIAAEMRLGRLYLNVPTGFMGMVAGIMNRLLPHPPVTAGQLSLLSVDNVTANNAADNIFAVDLDRFADNLGYVRSVGLVAAIGAVLGVRRFRKANR